MKKSGVIVFIQTMFFVLTAGCLFASNISESNQMVEKKSELSFLDQNYSFTYITIGNFMLPPFPELTVGKRFKRGKHGFDTCLGIGIGRVANRSFLNVSYLRYLNNKGIYMGCGCDMNLFCVLTIDNPLFVLPLPSLSVGKEKDRRFHQFKFVVPIPTIFYSYGFKF
jgi:hypothetical protein